MERRKVTIAIVTICLLIAAAILAYIIVWQKAKSTNTNDTANTNTSLSNVILANTNAKRELTEEEKARNEVSRIGTIFAERYGTYTDIFDPNDIQSVSSFITDAYRQALLKDAQAGTTANGIEIASQVLSTKVDALQLQSSAVVTVSVLRSQSNVNTNANVVKQDLSVRFVWATDTWKVDGSQWGKAEAAQTL